MATFIARLVLAAICCISHSSTSLAKDEKYYQRIYCVGMELEHILPSGGRVDCLSADYAIEVDYADKWAEAVGQSLYYAAATHRRPGIILLCPSSETHAEGLCRSYVYRLFDALSEVHTPVAVWECFLDTDKRLADCLRPSLQ
jgi:hypothetical protein